MCFSAEELEYYNHATRILGALKSYDFSVHGPGDFSILIIHLRKILLLWREHVFSGRGVGALKSCDAYSRSTKIVRFFNAWAGRFLKNVSFIFEKFFYSDERMCFPVAGLKHYNNAMRILGALKSYDFVVHGPGDYLKFILYLRKIPLLRGEGVFSSRGIGAPKSCDTYSWST